MTDHDRKDGMTAQRKSTLLSIEAMEQLCASCGGVFAEYEEHTALQRHFSLCLDPVRNGVDPV